LSCGICAELPRTPTAKNAKRTMTADPNLRYKNFLDVIRRTSR
jgi:hypothetical protein